MLEGYTFARIERGRVVERYDVAEDFDPYDPGEDADPGLIQVAEDYRLPSAFETPPVPKQEDGEETPNVPSTEAV